jgi:hypothetical protein
MLDIIFYPKNELPPEYVEVPEEVYEWLARSEFSKIGESIEKKISIDGEEEALPVVELDLTNRSQLRLFLLEAVAEESDTLLVQLGEFTNKEEYEQITYRLRKLQELRRTVENPKYQYLQRV